MCVRSTQDASQGGSALRRWTKDRARLGGQPDRREAQALAAVCKEALCVKLSTVRSKREPEACSELVKGTLRLQVRASSLVGYMTSEVCVLYLVLAFCRGDPRALEV